MKPSVTQPVVTHSFRFDAAAFGAEALTLTTKFIWNGDNLGNNVFVNQELTLNADCNKAVFCLFGTTITPERLRELADELEEARNEAKKEIEKMLVADSVPEMVEY